MTIAISVAKIPSFAALNGATLSIVVVTTPDTNAPTAAAGESLNNPFSRRTIFVPVCGASFLVVVIAIIEKQ